MVYHSKYHFFNDIGIGKLSAVTIESRLSAGKGRKDGNNKKIIWEVFVMTEDMTIIAEEAYLAAKEILEKARLEQGELFVVGCSTSEVGGATIGTYSSPELAEMVFGGIYQATQEAGIYLAAQCCEHLNRALILEKEAAV